MIQPLKAIEELWELVTVKKIFATKKREKEKSFEDANSCCSTATVPYFSALHHADSSADILKYDSYDDSELNPCLSMQDCLEMLET